MGSRRRKLIQNYEDAKLALLLYEYAEVYGEISTEQYEKDLANGKIKKISDQEAEAELNAILQRAEEEEAKGSRTHARFKSVVRKITMVAASIAIFFALMVTVQAAGIDVFGAVGKWTDSLFHFEYDSGTDNDPKSDVKFVGLSSIAEIRKNMVMKGFPLDVTPAWIPDDFSVKKISFPENDDVQSVAFLLVNSTGDWLLYQSSSVSEGDSFDDIMVEKNEGSIETIISNDRLFYIFQNESVWTGIYQGQEYRISIQIAEKNDLIQIIKSIGGMNYD